MKILDNITMTVKDDLQSSAKKGSKLSIAAACFSIYAYQELKRELERIDELRFIFTSPTFIQEKVPKAKREFYIPRLNRERSLYGTEFEVKLRNELTQKAIAQECADWIRRKAVFKSNVTQEQMMGFLTVDESTYMPKLDDAFLTYASNILADTSWGFSGSQIVEFCNSYAIDFNRVTPHGSYPFDAPNKRTALKENLQAFEAAEQFRIIKELCDAAPAVISDETAELKQRLYTRYGNLATERISETELIQKTKHWLSNYPGALKQYESALAKYEGGIFERNTLDDMRLAFELLVKDLLKNNKSLENQISDIGSMLKNSGASAELRNMVSQVIKYYTDFQNNHVKHTDAVNSDELEYVIELTSVIMKFLVKINGNV